MTGAATEIGAFRALLHLQMLKVRQTWIFHLVLPCLIAIGTVWLRARSGTYADDPQVLQRYACGAALLAAIFSTVNASAHDMARATETGEVEYLATYPVRRAMAVLAYISFPVCCAVPTAAFTLAASAWLLGLPAHVTLLAVLILTVVSLMLGGVGIALGLYLTPRVATSVASLGPVLLAIMTPILFTSDALPRPFELATAWLPTTLAVDLLDATTFGQTTATDIARLSIVAATGLIVIALVAHLPGWRGDR